MPQNRLLRAEQLLSLPDAPGSSSSTLNPFLLFVIFLVSSLLICLLLLSFSLLSSYLIFFVFILTASWQALRL